MGESLAVLAALCFGGNHFLSGLLSRRAHSLAVAASAQCGGVVLITAVAGLVPAPQVSLTATGWGCLSGVGAGIGVAYLFRGMSRGRLSIVVPLSDITAVSVPVLVGVALLGDRPSPLAWAGIVAAVPTLWMLSRGSAPTRTNGAATGSTDGLVAGIGFATHFVALAQVPTEAGFWPLVASRVVSLVVLLAMAAPSRVRLWPGLRIGLEAAAVGMLGTTATALYMLAAQQQVLTIAAVLAALYPAIPVLLGLLVLRERLARTQAAGLGLAAVAVTLIATS